MGRGCLSFVSCPPCPALGWTHDGPAVCWRQSLTGKGSWLSPCRSGKRDVHPCAARRSRGPLFSRPFLDMVYHALDSADDDYHALFVLCLLYAMSHNKGKPAHAPAFLPSLPSCRPCPPRSAGKKASCFPRGISFLVGGLPPNFSSNRFSISQVLFYRLKPQESVTQATWVEKKIQV